MFIPIRAIPFSLEGERVFGDSPRLARCKRSSRLSVQLLVRVGHQHVRCRDSLERVHSQRAPLCCAFLRTEVRNRPSRLVGRGVRVLPERQCQVHIHTPRLLLHLLHHRSVVVAPRGQLRILESRACPPLEHAGARLVGAGVGELSYRRVCRSLRARPREPACNHTCSLFRPAAERPREESGRLQPRLPCGARQDTRLASLSLRADAVAAVGLHVGGLRGGVGGSREDDQHGRHPAVGRKDRVH
mmetsp:Transcript_71688/g.186895  ORF Transcript_71688/g.186895 Transcript_71688/m.186895 type:complete len:244 (+) Transcript_71688:299-1030(+)